MVPTPLYTLVKVTLLLVLISSVTSKSITKRSEEKTTDNEIEVAVPKEKPVLNNPEVDPFRKEKPAKEIEKSPEKPKEEIDLEIREKVSTNERKDQEKPANQNVGHKEGIDPTASTDTSDIARSSRNIGRLREVESPATLIENFRNKLKTARSNLEESLAARKANEPRLFLFDPTADKIKPVLQPTKSSYVISRTAEGLNPDGAPIKPEEENQKIVEPPYNQKVITSPMIDDSSSSSEEDNKKYEVAKPEDASTTRKYSKARQNPEASEDISHLLHVRDEINKIRHMMQALREQQLRQQFGAQFPHSRNLTEDETNDLASIIDKLKDQGKISTASLKPEGEEDTDFQNHPPETTKLIEDIKKLKESVLSFAKQVGGPKATIGSIEELEKQIHQQREEIETLKRLVDELQPPKHFPSNPIMIKHPLNVKTDLHQELRGLQDILNTLLKKEEEKEHIQLRFALRNAVGDSSNKPQRTDEEIGTLMKIFQSMLHSNPGGRQSASIETKLETLERELKEMDSQHQRARQEILLQKLEHDIKTMKSSSKFSSDQEEDIKEKIRRLEEGLGNNQQLKRIDPMFAKIAALENQLQQISKPQSRSMVLPGDIEKELDNLQNEIDLITLKNLQSKSGQQPMSSRQLESLFTDILSPSIDDSTPNASIGKLKGIIKPLTKLEASHDIHSSSLTPILPSKSPDVPSKTGYAQPPIFQLPFCLQKNSHSHPYVVNNPQYHPYHPSQQQQPSGGYEKYPSKGKIEDRPYPGQKPVKPQGYNNEQQENQYKPQYGTKQQSDNQQGYNNEDQRPIKSQNEATGYNNGQSSSQKYNNKEVISEPETKPIIHRIYQPSVPKATPVKIEYHPPQEADEHQEYGYPVEDMQYQSYKPYKPPYHNHANIDEEMKHLNGMIGDLDEKIDYSQDLEPKYDMYHTKNYKPRNKRDADYDYDKKLLYTDIRKRLATLREAVESVQDNQSYLNSSENDLSSDFQRSAYTPENYQPYEAKYSYPVKIRRKQKFDNLFIKIVKFILHKLEISAPYVIESLFNGEAFENEFDGNENGYRSSKNTRGASNENDNYYNSDENDVQRSFGGFFNNFQGFHGLLGFIPTVLFKLLSNFSSFLNILKQNKFFKNFLFPGGMILAVDGIMALLVWWFSTDENHNILTYQNNNSNYVNQQY